MLMRRHDACETSSKFQSSLPSCQRQRRSSVPWPRSEHKREPVLLHIHRLYSSLDYASHSQELSCCRKLIIAQSPSYHQTHSDHHHCHHHEAPRLHSALGATRSSMATSDGTRFVFLATPFEIQKVLILRLRRPTTREISLLRIPRQPRRRAGGRVLGDFQHGRQPAGAPRWQVRRSRLLNAAGDGERARRH